MAKPTKKKNPAAVALAALGASKGGKTRAQKLSAQRRRDIARKASAARMTKSLPREGRRLLAEQVPLAGVRSSKSDFAKKKRCVDKCYLARAR
jgi:hypothetical protein